MKWFILLITLFSSIQTGITQSEGTFDIHFVPLPLYDKNPRLRLGMEYRGRDRVGYSLEMGFGNSQLNKKHLEKTVFGKDYSFFEVQAELKWYMNDSDAASKYFSADLFYAHMKDELVHGYYYPALRSDGIRYEEASFRKQKFGLLVKAGVKFLIWKRVVVDLYEGVGIAIRNIEYTNLKGISYEEIYPPKEWFEPPHVYAGNVVLFQFAMGIKVGYIIARQK